MQAERQQLLVEWNETSSDYARGDAASQIVRAASGAEPEAVALVFAGRAVELCAS